MPEPIEIPPHRTPIARAEKLVPSLLMVLGMVGITGVVALLFAAYPVALDDVAWRYRTAVFFMGAAAQFAVLLTIVSLAGVMVGKHSAVRFAGAVFITLGVLYLVALPLFALDFLSLRHMQAQNQIGAFTRDGFRLAATSAALIPFFLFAGRKAWVEGRQDPAGELGEGHGLIVGQAN